MRRIFLLGIFILLVAAGCRKPDAVSFLNIPTTTQDTAGWRVYTSDEFGYRIKYPPEWIVNTYKSNDDDPFAAYNSATSFAVSGRMFSIGVSTKEIPVITPATETITVSGSTVVAYTYPYGSCKTDGPNYCMLFFVPIHHGNVWYYFYADGDPKVSTPIYSQIISTFEFTK